MIKYFILLSFVRFFVQSVTDTYNAKVEHCAQLLDKARAAEIDTVRSAYCVEVVEADQKATLETLKQFRIAFLASNETYSTTEQVLSLSCRVPDWVTVFLAWTAGVGPLTFLWSLYLFFMKVKKDAPLPKRPRTPPSSPEKPPLRPPPPRKTKRYVRDLNKLEPPRMELPETIPEPTPETTAKTTAKQILGTFGKVSPALRKRIMGDNV